MPPACRPPLRSSTSTLPKLPTLHVLTIGINNYKDAALDLKYAAPDAEALAQAFAKNCKGQPFQDVKTKTLLNQEATATNIANEIAQTAQNSRPAGPRRRLLRLPRRQAEEGLLPAHA